MGLRQRDRLDIGAETSLPFEENLFVTFRLAAEILSSVPIDQRATCLRAIRLKYEDIVSRGCWQRLEPIIRGYQGGRRVTVFLHGDEPSSSYRLTGEIEDTSAGWILHEAGVTVTGAPSAWSNGIAVGSPLSRHLDIPILGERTVTGVTVEDGMTRLHLDDADHVPGIPHIAEPF